MDEEHHALWRRPMVAHPNVVIHARTSSLAGFMPTSARLEVSNITTVSDGQDHDQCDLGLQSALELGRYLMQLWHATPQTFRGLKRPTLLTPLPPLPTTHAAPNTNQTVANGSRPQTSARTSTVSGPAGTSMRHWALQALQKIARPREKWHTWRHPQRAAPKSSTAHQSDRSSGRDEGQN